MAVKIFIKRKVLNKNIIDLMIMLRKLRTLTLSQPGYISGETLKRIDIPYECVVISTWRSIDDWNHWIRDEKRVNIQREIDDLLGEKTEYAVYEV